MIGFAQWLLDRAEAATADAAVYATKQARLLAANAAQRAKALAATPRIASLAARGKAQAKRAPLPPPK